MKVIKGVGIGCGVIIALFIGSAIVIGIYDAATGQSSAPQAAATDQPAAEVATDEPTEPPTPKPLTRAQQKQIFLQGVDESISGARIAGNPYKFVGDKVDLHGTVMNVLDDSSFNFSTGDIDSGDEAVILVTTDRGGASQLEAGQALRILGVVQQPTAGTNAMGGSMNFPTVQAKFME